MYTSTDGLEVVDVGDDILRLGSFEDVSEFGGSVSDVCPGPARAGSENGQEKKRVGDVVGKMKTDGAVRSKGTHKRCNDPNSGSLGDQARWFDSVDQNRTILIILAAEESPRADIRAVPFKGRVADRHADG